MIIPTQKPVTKAINKSKSFLGNSKYATTNRVVAKKQKGIVWTFEAIKHDYYVKSKWSKILLALVNMITVLLSALNIIFQVIYVSEIQTANSYLFYLSISTTVFIFLVMILFLIVMMNVLENFKELY